MSILNIYSYPDIMCHNYMRANNIVQDQILRKDSFIKSKVEH